MIALALEDCLLSELDSVFFLQLAYHTFEEFKLIFFLDDLSVYLDHNFLFDSFLIKSVSRNLSKKFETFNSSPFEALIIELITVCELSLFTSIETSPVFVVGEKDFLQTLDSPLVDPGSDN